MTVQDLIKALFDNMSDSAEDVLTYAIDEVRKTDDPETETVNLKDYYLVLNKEAQRYFRDGREALKYLRDFAKNDVSEAVDNGCKTITSIANYYLLKEAKKAISNYIEYNFNPGTKEYNANVFRQECKHVTLLKKIRNN